MAKQKTLAIKEIPPLAFGDYRVDIQLRICREGARYGMDIQVRNGPPQRVSIDMQPHDLKDLNRQLQKELEAISSENVKSTEPTSAELEAQLLPLAEVGHLAFKQVFGDSGLWEDLQSLLTPAQQQFSIQVTSEDFFLPWELLYPASLNEPLYFEYFWGMNYVISRVIPQDFRRGAFVPPDISFALRPRLGLLTYSNLPSVGEKEIPFFERLKGDDKIFLFRMRALDPTPAKKRDEFKALRDFLNRAFDVIHFACHAFYEDEAHLRSRILLSDNFPITLGDMKSYGIAMKNNPLVIMNACETGNLNPLYTSYFAAAFLKYGARGVVATECAVPDAFAADFAQQLYAHLLAGEPLGKSLLATRRYFLEEYHNPSGLLYSMYAPPSIRLAQIGG